MFTSAKHDTKVFNDKNAYTILVLNWYDLSKCLPQLLEILWMNANKTYNCEIMKFCGHKMSGLRNIGHFNSLISNYMQYY